MSDWTRIPQTHSDDKNFECDMNMMSRHHVLSSQCWPSHFSRWTFQTPRAMCFSFNKFISFFSIFFGFWFTLLAFHINIFEYVLLPFAITTLFRKHIVHNKKELAFITYIILYEKGKLEHKKSARTLLYNRYHFACLYSFKYLLYSMQMLNDNHWMYIWICMCVVFEMLAANKRKTQSLRLSHHRLEYSETRNILHYYIYVILFFSVFLCVFVFTTYSHHEKLCIWARTSQLHISNIYKR